MRHSSQAARSIGVSTPRRRHDHQRTRTRLAERLGRTESAVRQRASRLRALQLDEDVDAVDGPSVMR